jgi:hypothetical protein
VKRERKRVAKSGQFFSVQERRLSQSLPPTANLQRYSHSWGIMKLPRRKFLHLAAGEASAWQGIGVPKNTPAEIIEKLNKEVTAGLADSKMKARIADLGSTVAGIKPD